jgi:hypothetical protein
MKKAVLLVLISCISYASFSHPPREEFDYSIVFGGGFTSDVVSLKINNTKIFDHIKVENGNAIKKGNLSLTQKNDKLTLFYNGDLKLKTKIEFDYYLDITLTLNDQVNKFKVDLRKGKVIVVDRASADTSKKLIIEQIEEPVILM